MHFDGEILKRSKALSECDILRLYRVPIWNQNPYLQSFEEEKFEKILTLIKYIH